ncbi:MAG: branched-chain-amino-acid transaminase [Thermodesulfovibrionales bacterium]
MYVYLNDRTVPRAEATVSVFDHGFLYGDGVYETLRVYDGVAFMLEEHIARLQRSAALTGLDLGRPSDAIKLAMYETLTVNDFRNAYVRIMATRGFGPPGIDPDLCKEPTFVIIAEEFKPYPRAFYESGVKVIIPRTRRNHPDALNPRIKSLNFLNNILAKIEAKQAEAYEALMLNSAGRLAEGTITNVFFMKGGVLCTPSVECGILDGITRGIVLDLAVRDGVTVREGEFTPEDIYAAEEVFITNTTLEVMPVSKVDDREYEVGDTARLLLKSYRQEVKAHVALVKSSGPSLWGYNE